MPEKSYVGIQDWLRSFVILFAMSGVYGVYSLSSFIDRPIGEQEIAEAISAIITSTMSITTVILILMRKKAGKQMAIFTTVVEAAIYVIYMSALANMANSELKDASIVVMSIVGIVIFTILICALTVPYFLKSRRVKETLVN